MARPQEGDPLEIVAGSTEPLRVLLLDERGKPESLAAVDLAVLTIVDGDGGDPVLHRSTEAPATLAVHDSAGHEDADDDPSYVEATLTTEESAALAPGLYVGQAALRFGDSPEAWKFTDEFHVRVRAPVAVTP